MTTSRRFDSSGENCSDFSDSYQSSDDDSHVEAQSWTTIQHQRSDPCVLTGNSSLLWDLSCRIGKIWKQVGRNVGIKESIIDSIEIEYEGESNREKAYQLLLVWTRALGSKAMLHDIENAISYEEERSSVRSEHIKDLEIERHAKQQKQLLKQLKKALQFYKKRLGELEDFQRRVFKEKEAQEMKEKLQELDKNIVLRKLEFLQKKVSSIQGLKNSQLDQQLRIVADKLYELDKTFIEFNHILDDLRVISSEVKCVLGGVFQCGYRRISRGSSSSKLSRTLSNDDEELDDEVFREPREDSKSKTSHSFTRHAQSGSPIGKLFCPKETRIPQGQEEHTRRELGVSLVDSDDEIQLQDFVKKFCTRYRQLRVFTYDPSDENPRPLSPIDPNTLPIPCYQSTEEIISQYTPRGFFNVVGDLI